LAGRFAIAAVVLSTFLAASNLCNADNLSSARQEAARELSPFFNRSVSITGVLVETVNPEALGEMLGGRLVGCPEAPAAPIEDDLSLSFATFGAGPWAGDLDGINTKIEKPTGEIGGGLAVPTNSTARAPGSTSGPELDFSFNPALNIRRALVDAAAEEFDRCFSKVPAGSYTYEEIVRLCPPRLVSRGEQNQTCVLTTDGTVGKALPNGSGYEVNLSVGTMCDFVGYGRSGNQNTGFTTCFYQRYSGVATFDAPASELRARNAQLRAITKRAQRKCGSSKGKIRSTQVKACVVRHMSAAMAKK